VDVFPTLLKLAGISRPSGLQGMSLVLDQGDSPPPPTRMVVTEVEMYGVYRVTVRNHLYKLTHHEPLNEKEFLKFYPDTRIYPSVVKGIFKRELYNLQLDPHETRDVYATERPSISSLETALERYMKTGDLDDPDAGQAPSEEVLKDLKSLGYIQ
jgi:arylsulfatase A-like enzyme